MERDQSKVAVSSFVRMLKSAVKRIPGTAALVRQSVFLRELFAHRKLIRPYASPHGRSERGRVVDAPLLVGYFETDFGLGEYARALASALAAVEFPFAVYPYHGFTGRARSGAPWAWRYDVDHAHAVNIFCMAADETEKARRIIGKRHTQASYNILSTFWELPRAPEAWRPALDNFDELWAPNHYVADAFRPIFPKTISIVPPCVATETNVAANRQKFGLDAATFYFLFSFDLNSYPERKNPLAVAKAFEMAFGGAREDVGLIFKTNGNAHLFPNMVSQLEAIAKNDPRITFFHGEWPRADVLGLLASADCYVSLHRSEGFGLGMAESMLLGKPVIGTAYSGNAEFLTAETGFPIPYATRAVGAGEYPHHAGNVWAEPNLDIAAATMRLVASRGDEARSKAAQGQAFIRGNFSPQAVGRVAATRLRELTAMSRR